MKPFYRYSFLIVYVIFNLTLFWYAQFFLECVGFFCAFLPTMSIWAIFIVTTFLVYRAKPLPFGKTLVRFFVTTTVVILMYAAYYNWGDTDWSNNHMYMDYSLPGILLTIGYGLVWFLPENINFRRIED